MKRFFLVAVLFVLGTAVAATGVAAAWLKARTESSTCTEVPRSVPTLAEVAALWTRIRAHQEEPADPEPLRLASDEVGLLVGDSEAMRITTELRGDRVRATIAVPSGLICYNIDFDGQIAVDDGVATLTPDRLVVGRLDVSSLVAGIAFHLTPAQVPDARVGQILANTRTMRVLDGEAVVSLDDDAELR